MDLLSVAGCSDYKRATKYVKGLHKFLKSQNKLNSTWTLNYTGKGLYSL